ncbi:DNA repair protein [Lactococcus lactis]|uniref:DNA repair protein n=1 Tax=Lactococcus lactis TaxID=1358 RepID=UPI002658BC14|nr:DNA repair protein [Lactococcus lactis]WKG35825.1 DNA repair protein [Lactococcus lactis subsp. lactis]
MKDRKNEKMAYNDSPENLDDIFLTKDKNKLKANKERSSEEKARETEQIVDNLKKMQEAGKRRNEEQKNEVHYERNGLVRFESLTKQKPRKIKRGKSYQVFMENIDIYLESNVVRLEIKKLLQDTKDYLLQGVFDVFDANRYLRGNIYFLVHKGSQLNDYERKILKSFKNKSYLKNIITIISICVITYLIFKYI